jgi:beta-lactamase regulating signal transducer with metallopeptidase domain
MDAIVNMLLERLLATSMQTALLTFVVWMLCRNLARLSPASQCWLWWLVALQAVLGLIVGPIELYWLPHEPAVFPPMPISIQSDAVPMDYITPATVAGHPRFSWQGTVVLLWAAGVLVMAWYTLLERRRSKTVLKDSLPCNEESMLQSLAQACAACGVRTPGLCLSDRISSPVLVGHIRPMLLLPSGNALSNEELDMALVHELTHLRRGDLWWGLIPSLARHLFFFHPFAHLAVREYGTAREAACDAAVVNSGQLSREDYGRLLVRLGTSPESRTGLAVASPTFRSLSTRLTMLQNTSFLSRAGSIAVLAFAAIGVLPLRLVAAAGVPAPSNAAAAAGPAATELSSLPLNAQNFLDRQVAEIEKKLREDEARIADFKARNSYIASTGGRGDYFTSVATAMAGMKQAENNLVQAIARQSELQKQLDAVRDSVLKPVEASIGANAAASQSNQIELNNVQLEIATLQSVIEAHRKEILKITQVVNQKPQLEQQYRQLVRDYESDKKQYELLVAKRAQIAGESMRREQAQAVEIKVAGDRPGRVPSATQASGPNNVRATQSTPQTAPDEYKIAAEDILQISVWQYPDLGMTVRVRPDGKFSSPLVENMPAAGKTPSQLARDIEDTLGKFIRSPRVTVILK